MNDDQFSDDVNPNEHSSVNPGETILNRPRFLPPGKRITEPSSGPSKPLKPSVRPAEIEFTLPEIYYDDAPKDYWITDGRGSYMRISEGSLKRFLKELGYISISSRDGSLSQLEEGILEIQRQNRIYYAGSLAGYRAGVHDVAGKLILVTDSPKFIVPREGKWDLLNEFFDNLLNDGEIDQRPYFFGWLKQAMNCLQSEKRYPGQALVVAGEKGCENLSCKESLPPYLGAEVLSPTST